MSIFKLPTPAVRPAFLGAILASACLAACVADAPGITDGKAGTSHSSDSSGNDAGGEPSTAGTGGNNPSAGSGAQGSSAGTAALGGAADTAGTSTGGTQAVTDPDAGGAANEGGAGGSAEPPVATSCVFHTSAPPPIEGAGGADAAPTIVVQQSPFIGQYLADAAGRTLFTYGNDFPGDCQTAPVSNCEADCLVSWPVFDAGLRVLDEGLDDAGFGTMQRSDGTPQTTYFGWPLYYYKTDLVLGQLTGQGKGKTWHAAEPIPASVFIMKIGMVKYLADSTGHTLYVSAADQAGSGSSEPVSNCTGDCLDTFEPFQAKALSPVTSLEPADFAVFLRAGSGGLQLAYKGLPLYRSATDLKSGDMNGAAVPGFTAALP